MDSTAQKDRAALSQSKGLQNRRLPSSIAGKVPEDYSERRRSNTYAGKVGRTARQTMEESDSVDGVTPEITISEEERKQRVSGLSPDKTHSHSMGRICFYLDHCISIKLVFYYHQH